MFRFRWSSKIIFCLRLFNILLTMADLTVHITSSPGGSKIQKNMIQLLTRNSQQSRRHVMLTICAQSLNDNMDEMSRNEITCFRCGEIGHKKQECRTWKTKMCRHQNCSDPATCSFAHSEAELRTPWVARCIRVVRSGEKLIKIGCQRSGHTFRDCPYRHEYNILEDTDLKCQPCYKNESRSGPSHYNKERQAADVAWAGPSREDSVCMSRPSSKDTAL